MLIRLSLCWGQQIDDSQAFLSESLNNPNLRKDELLSKCNKLDFSSIWLGKRPIFGFIGNNFQRFMIKYNVIIKNVNSPNKYYIFGQTKVKSSINDFIGEIELLHIRKINNQVKDDEYKSFIKNYAKYSDDEKEELEKLKYQEYELVANYLFYQKPGYNSCGIFRGVLESLFYLKGNEVYYDNIIFGDKFSNNLFVGTWTDYNNDTICKSSNQSAPFTIIF